MASIIHIKVSTKIRVLDCFNIFGKIFTYRTDEAIHLISNAFFICNILTTILNAIYPGGFRSLSYGLIDSLPCPLHVSL